MPDSILVERLE